MTTEQATLNMMDWAIGRIAGDPNVSTSFKKVLQKEICTDCGKDIREAGQEVKYIDSKPYCEDCFDYRVEQAQKDEEDERIFRLNHKDGGRK